MSALTDDEIIEIDTHSLVGSLSPRADPLDADHVAVLAAVFDDLPAIVVHEPAMRVIDGFHRLHASLVLGRDRIPARLWHGDDTAAQIEAIRLNVAHGKPLTRRDRDNAVLRVLTLQPNWSDRRIANTCGVSPTKVEAARRRAAIGGLDRRVGKDGRARTVDPAGVRLQIAAVLAAEPQLSNREIARRARGSEATVRDVRRRQSLGEPVLPERQRASQAALLANDPALRSDDRTVAFADWLAKTAVDATDWNPFVGVVPLGRIYDVIDEARRRAESWHAFALQLEGRTRHTAP